MLKKGDPCFIRNYYGEIERCTYGFCNGRVHTVYDRSGNSVKICRLKPENLFMGRFVCMTGIKGKDKCTE